MRTYRVFFYEIRAEIDPHTPKATERVVKRVERVFPRPAEPLQNSIPTPTIGRPQNTTMIVNVRSWLRPQPKDNPYNSNLFVVSS